MSGHDENVDWSRVTELRGEGLDSQAALAQARQEHDVAAAVDDIDVELDGEDASGSCSTFRSVEWCADHLTDKGVQASDAPSPCAWGLLLWARGSPASRGEFYRNIWSKTLPSRQELDNAARYSDDGSTQIELAQRILARLEAQRTEDEAGRKRRAEIFERKCAEARAEG